MRIIAGQWRGRPLLAPPAAPPAPPRTGPAKAFLELASRLGLRGPARRRLFAGTGALGLEALSRGAAHCTLVERDRTALAAIELNIAKLGAGAGARSARARSNAPARRATLSTSS